MAKNESNPLLKTKTNRRALLKKAAYVTPVILTLAATPSFAGSGSKSDRRKNKDQRDKRKY